MNCIRCGKDISDQINSLYNETELKKIEKIIVCKHCGKPYSSQIAYKVMINQVQDMNVPEDYKDDYGNNIVPDSMYYKNIS